LAGDPWFSSPRERALYVAFVVAISTRMLALLDALVVWVTRRYLHVT
jgi:hypothetical protein